MVQEAAGNTLRPLVALKYETVCNIRIRRPDNSGQQGSASSTGVGEVVGVGLVGVGVVGVVGVGWVGWGG